MIENSDFRKTLKSAPKKLVRTVFIGLGFSRIYFFRKRKMKNLILRLFGFSIFVIFLTISEIGNCGWTLWVSTPDECIDKYLKESKCDRGTKLVLSSCYILYGKDELSENDREFYQCVLDEAIMMQNNLAINLALSKCKRGE